jgi:hypothetical protein
LPEAIASILNQNHAHCIIHLIADGFSTPESILSFVTVPGVKLYETSVKHPIGPYRITNCLVPYLETEYLAIQDSDDIAMPNRIAHSIAQMNDNGWDHFGAAMMQFASYESRDETSIEALQRTPIHYSGTKVRWKISPDGVFINGVRVIRKNAFIQVNGFADLLTTADCEFNTRCLRSGMSCGATDVIVALRRLHSDSLSLGRTHGMYSADRQAIYDKLMEWYAAPDYGTDPVKYGSLDSNLVNYSLAPIKVM